jgi:NAD(P)-dependent dehydrogenase (short-subunit alcohol dehydrogenase family)
MKLDATVSAIVTGGASGLGAATARALAGHGVRVAIFDLNDAKGEPFAKEIGAAFCRVDVTDEASVDAGFAQARGANGQERILVNCAGTAVAIKTASRARDTGEIRQFPLAAFNSVIQINLVGTFRCIVKSAAGMLTLPPLDDGERGAIVNTASVAAEDGQMGQVAYSASKAGIVGMTLPIARDLAAEGIRVNTILPGIFDTPLMQGAAPNVKEALAASVPFPRRFGRPEEYASLALEILRNGYLNGEDIRLDGAIRMAPR